MPSVRDLSCHWSVGSRTIRQYIDKGLRAYRVGRQYRVEWGEIWRYEHGACPRPAQHERYKAPLATKQMLGEAAETSLRTVDRWIARGLPTRNVGGNVRCNIYDAADWLERHVGMDSHILARKLLESHKRIRSRRRFDYGHVRATGADLPLLAREQSKNYQPSRPDAPRSCGRRARGGEPA